MNSESIQDLSLYELALSSEPSLIPLQLSPATLKSTIAAMVDLLIDQQISAHLWVKLPQDEAWQSEIKRYCELVSAPHWVYWFNNYKDEAAEERELKNGRSAAVLHAPPTAESATLSTNFLQTPERLPSWAQSQREKGTALLDDQGAGLAPAPEETSFCSIQLAPESQLKREYFLLVVAEQFSGLIVAHRPRSIRYTKPADPTPTNAAGSKSTVDDDPLERKQPLLTLCSFQGKTVQQGLTGIQQAIARSQSQRGTLSETLPAASVQRPSHASTACKVDMGSINWERLRDQCLTQPIDANLLSHLLIKQVQRQEEVWHRNATYRKQAEVAETLQLQNEALLTATRLKDEFLNNVGQELRTPLTNMKTALTLLNSPNLKPTQRQRYMQVLSTECDRQSSLITSLLDLVQLNRDVEHATMQPIPLSDVVPGVVSTYQPLAQEKGVMLAYTIPENLPPVSSLSAWLKQIMINLLHNSIKFTPTGGQVWVRAKQQGDYIQLEFRDTGIGIPASEIPKIFDRFYRVRHVSGEDPGGAGLGLTIVQQILLRCGGSISVKSKIGEGSTFNVLLPIYRNIPELTSP